MGLQGRSRCVRTHVSNNWQITDKKLNSGFFSKDQQDLIEALFWGMYTPDWHDRIKKQLQDDAGGYGKEQSIAIFGTPGSGKFEFVMTGRHLTIRADGDSTDHAAFGGPNSKVPPRARVPPQSARLKRWIIPCVCPDARHPNGPRYWPPSRLEP